MKAGWVIMTLQDNVNLYDDSLTVQEGLEKYFKTYRLDDGGYTKKTFSIKFFGPFKITLPNIKNRAEAVKFHDIHHVLNEYKTGLKGEAEIGAWEIGAGCGKYYSAWLLDYGSLLYGIPLWPKMTFNAYAKGRKCKSLLSGFNYDERLLKMPVGELRIDIGLKNLHSNNFTDIILFTTIYIMVILTLALPVWIFIIFKFLF